MCRTKRSLERSARGTVKKKTPPSIFARRYRDTARQEYHSFFSLPFHAWATAKPPLPTGPSLASLGHRHIWGGSRQRYVRGRKRGRAGCAGRFPSATAKGGGIRRGRGGRGQSPVRLGRQAGHVDRGRDVAVSPLRRRRGRVAVHRLPHHRHPAAALRARRLRADAELPFVPALGAVSRSYPLVGYRRRHHGAAMLVYAIEGGEEFTDRAT